MCNHEQLSLLLSNLISKNLNIVAVALQEVWSVPYPDSVKIPGFNLILNTRKNSRGGGVGFYLSDKFDFNVLRTHSLFIEKEFECLTLETSINGKKFILSNIYRSPSPTPNIPTNSQIELFNTRLDSHLHNLSQLNPNSLVFLDANINLLKLTNNQMAADYLETVHNNGFLQLISKATRIAGDSFSLIDHILCNNFNPLHKTGTLLSDISDHFINFICIPSTNNLKPPPNQVKYMRSFTLHNLTNFRNDLRNLN
jgi:hypothetical protein